MECRRIIHKYTNLKKKYKIKKTELIHTMCGGEV